VFYLTRVYQMQPRNGQNWHSSVGKYVHHNRETAKIGFCTSLKSVSISSVSACCTFLIPVLLILEIKSMQISFKSVRIFVTICGKTWQAPLGNCQNRNSLISKIVCLLPLCLKQQASSRPHFRAVRKVLWKMVRNRSRPYEIDAETEICISLKSEFYFRFRRPPSTKSTLISYISFRVFVTIHGKICPPQWRK